MTWLTHCWQILSRLWPRKTYPREPPSFLCPWCERRVFYGRRAILVNCPQQCKVGPKGRYMCTNAWEKNL